jgi:hypothetical protein
VGATASGGASSTSTASARRPATAGRPPFTVDTATFWESKAPIETLGGADLDGLATAECPDVRTAVLKAIGVGSFGEV